MTAVACPDCGETDSWREWAYVAVSQPITLDDDGRYHWQISDNPTWEDQKHDYWECENCRHVASPETASAIYAAIAP